MRKTMHDYAAALKFARAFCDKHSATTYVVSDRKGTAIVYTAVDAPEGARPGARYSPGFGVYFTCDGNFPGSPLPDVPPLPGRGEYYASMTLSYVQCTDRAKVKAIALGVEAHGTCVWHEASRVFGTLETCPCAPCARSRAAT